MQTHFRFNLLQEKTTPMILIHATSSSSFHIELDRQPIRTSFSATYFYTATIVSISLLFILAGKNETNVLNYCSTNALVLKTKKSLHVAILRGIFDANVTRMLLSTILLRCASIIAQTALLRMFASRIALE